MKPKKRQKMCYNCEGEIDLDVIVCPFCAADLREEKPEQFRSPFPPKAARVEVEAIPLPEIGGGESPSGEGEEAREGKAWLPTLLFSLGLQLTLFGLFLLLFSRDGVLSLQWDATLWFLYLLGAIPCLVFGYRGLSKL